MVHMYWEPSRQKSKWIWNQVLIYNIGAVLLTNEEQSAGRSFSHMILIHENMGLIP